LIELPPFEVLLPLGALAFYAYDCCLMLFDDETVQHWTGTAWLPQRPTSVVLMRKRLLLLDLLRPDRMSLRTATEPVDLSAPPEALMQAVRPLQIGVLLLAGWWLARSADAEARRVMKRIGRLPWRAS
jgi:hypothetical protein